MSEHIGWLSLFGERDTVDMDLSTSNCPSSMAQQNLRAELSSSNTTSAKIKKLLYALAEYLSLSK